jgi:hypothetical protein
VAGHVTDPPEPPAGGGEGGREGGAGGVPVDPFGLRFPGRPLPSRLGRSRRGGAGAAGTAGAPAAGPRAGGRAGPPERDHPLRRAADRAGGGLDRLGGVLMVGPAPAGAAVKASGKGVKVAAAAGPLAVLVVLLLLIVGMVPVTGTQLPGVPRVEPAEAATGEIPPGYLEAYLAADEAHDVPWPVLAAMGHVLTGHGARSPYDTVVRDGDRRYPVVDPAIAPGAPAGGAPAACRVRVIGDSLLAGMRDALPAELDGCAPAGIDARAGRTIREGAERLAVAPLTDETALVVVLGAADLAGAATAGELEARVGELVAASGGRPVVWQNVAPAPAGSPAAGGPGDPAVLDAALAAAARRFANLVVADWAGHLAGQQEGSALRAADGVHYTPEGYGVMAAWLARQVVAPLARPVEPPVGDGGLGPLLLDPTAYAGLTATAAQDVRRSVDLLAEVMGDIADDARTGGAAEARASRFGGDALPAAEKLWRTVVAAAPVVTGESACLEPDPTLPVPQIVEVVWRCEMLRTPPRPWTRDGVLEGADAQNLLLGEAHVVAAAWSDYGTARCDPAAAHAGVFPLPVTAAADRCDPVANVRAAARLVLDQESRPLAERSGTGEWARAAAGWATMAPALGEGAGNRFTRAGPPAGAFVPSPACRRALDALLEAEAGHRPAFPGLSPLALFEPRAVDLDPDHWETVFATTLLEPLLRTGGACDPGSGRAAGFAWLAGRLAGHQVEGEAVPGLAGAIAYATWEAGRGAFPVAGRTGLVPRLHNPRLVAPRIDRPQVTGVARPVNPATFAERVVEKAKVYAGHTAAVPIEVLGWESLAALGIPEHAARAYVAAVSRVAAIEPGCAIDLAYLAGFGYMESGHGTVAVGATGKADDPPPRRPVTWDPGSGASQPALLGVLLDGSGAGGNITPHPNDLPARHRAFYRQDDAYLRAVGPTQFLPATWESLRDVADGNGDGVADPFNYYDGALATAVKACRDGRGLADQAGRRAAALAYNGSGRYADGVLSRAAGYRAGLAAMGQATTGGETPGVVVLPDGPVSIVDVYGVPVNAAIADRFRALVDAARADGLELAQGSGGWRSPERQIELRRAHCGTGDYAVYEMPPSQCSPPTARPGTSEHERGLAIDFRCGGEAIGRFDRADPCYRWLRANAARYGLYNLPSEAWHWSVNGS